MVPHPTYPVRRKLKPAAMERKINTNTMDKNTKDKQMVEYGIYGIPPYLAGPQVVLLIYLTTRRIMEKKKSKSIYTQEM